MYRRILTVIGALALVSAACAMLPAAAPQPSLTPAPAAGSTATGAPVIEASPTPVIPTQAPESTATAAPALIGPYAVTLIAPEGALKVFESPEAGSPMIKTLPWDEITVMRTGREQPLGDMTLVEIDLGDGRTGWVDRQYLTEYVPAETFCADPQVSDLLDRLAEAVNSGDGEKLAGLVSPVHGLYLTFFHTGNTIHYDPEQVGWLYNSTYAVNWGTQPASGMEVSGTFGEVVAPMLQDVFGKPNQRTCNNPALGPNSYTFQWPNIYRDMNYYSVTKPGTPGTELDWRTWLVGVEYVEGKPYVFALMHLFWEP